MLFSKVTWTEEALCVPRNCDDYVFRFQPCKKVNFWFFWSSVAHFIRHTLFQFQWVFKNVFFLIYLPWWDELKVSAEVPRHTLLHCWHFFLVNSPVIIESTWFPPPPQILGILKHVTPWSRLGDFSFLPPTNKVAVFSRESTWACNACGRERHFHSVFQELYTREELMRCSHLTFSLLLTIYTKSVIKYPPAPGRIIRPWGVGGRVGGGGGRGRLVQQHREPAHCFQLSRLFPQHSHMCSRDGPCPSSALLGSHTRTLLWIFWIFCPFRRCVENL